MRQSFELGLQGCIHYGGDLISGPEQSPNSPSKRCSAKRCRHRMNGLAVDRHLLSDGHVGLSVPRRPAPSGTASGTAGRLAEECPAQPGSLEAMAF